MNIRNLHLRNRIVWLPAVSFLADEDGFVTDSLIERYRLRAQGRAGLIIPEATAVHAGKAPGLLRINDDKYLPGLAKLVQTVHDEGAKISIQLFHFLKRSRSGWKQKVEDLTLDDIKQIKDEFVQAAVRAKAAGFDAIEIHAAHSYTLASFVSLLNKRKDEYGLSIQARAKIVTEIIEMCRTKLGDDFCIGARISGEEFVIGGNTLKQTKVITKLMAEKGLDYISVSAGGKNEDGDWYSGYSGTRAMPTANLPYGCHAYLAKGIRDVVAPAGVAVIASGKINTLELGEQMVVGEKTDLVGVCRPLLADPDWLVKQAEGQAKKIIKCIYCNTCLDRNRRFEPVECAEAEKKAGAKSSPGVVCGDVSGR